MKAKQYPTQDRLHELFGYEGGSLVRKTRSANNTKIGEAIGFKTAYGYVRAKVDGSGYMVHRLIWIYFNGDILDNTIEVDHINRDRSDNRIDNLRLATKQQNQWNSECKGYSYNKKDKHYRAEIMKDNKSYYLGSFGSAVEARTAYLEAKIEYHTY